MTFLVSVSWLGSILDWSRHYFSPIAPHRMSQGCLHVGRVGALSWWQHSSGQSRCWTSLKLNLAHTAASWLAKITFCRRSNALFRFRLNKIVSELLIHDNYFGYKRIVTLVTKDNDDMISQKWKPQKFKIMNIKLCLYSVDKVRMCLLLLVSGVSCIGNCTLYAYLQHHSSTSMCSWSGSGSLSHSARLQGNSLKNLW